MGRQSNLPRIRGKAGRIILRNQAAFIVAFTVFVALEKAMTKEKIKRCVLYNEQGSQIFEGEEAIQQALEAGYKDAPVPTKPEQSEADLIADLEQKLRKSLEMEVAANDRADKFEAELEKVKSELVKLKAASNKKPISPKKQ